jgi:type II secretory pathway pseudopilin PulG
MPLNGRTCFTSYIRTFGVLPWVIGKERFSIQIRCVANSSEPGPLVWCFQFGRGLKFASPVTSRTTLCYLPMIKRIKRLHTSRLRKKCANLHKQIILESYLLIRMTARARPLTSPAQARAWEDIQRIVSAIGKYAEGQKQKKDPSWRGAPAEAEYYPSDAEWSDPTWQAELNQDHPGLPTKDPWGRPYQYRHTGTIAPFSVFSLGRDGVEGGDDEDSDISTESQGNLIATWFEYTPTSGLDIEIDTPVNKIA